MRAALLATLAAGTTLTSSAWGQQTNDADNFFGDRISFPVNVRGVTLGSNSDGTPKSGPAVCIPAGTALRVGKNDFTLPAVDNQPERKGRVVYVSSYRDRMPQCDQPATGAATYLSREKILLGESEFTNTGLDRFGYTYGGLVVPFKYHVNGSKEFRAGSAIGPYVGYRFDRNTLGVGLKAIAFAALSTVAVEQNVDGVTKTQSLSGFSYGLGFIGQVKGDFQLGVVVGWDRVSKSANYADNGKAWVALTAGFDFLK